MKPLFRLAVVVMVALIGLGTPDRCGAADKKIPELKGSRWQLLSLTEKKKEKAKDAQNPADVEFLANGKWGILHYGGRREEGTYQVKDDHIIMKTITGDVYQDAKMIWKPELRTLELDSGKYLMRLKQIPPK